MTKTEKTYPEICPICASDLKQNIIKLAEGQKHAFIYEETCEVNSTHYSHLRFPNFNEATGG